MTLNRDGSALESIPLKLMIVAVVASLSVLPAAEALDGLRNRDFVRRAELQLDALMLAVQTLAVEGPGAVRTASLDFSCEGGLRFSSLTLGDREDGPCRSSVVLEFANGARMVRSALEPIVLMRSPDGCSLTVLQPVFDLRLTATMNDGASFVLVEEV